MLRSTVLAAIAAVLVATHAYGAPISNVDFTPDSPAVLPFGSYVDFTFDYDVPEAARIFGRPFFEGSLRLDYAAHPSGIYPSGTGSGSGFFTILDLGQGIARVDQIRFQIVAVDDSAVLNQVFVPVDFTFGRVPEPGTLSLLCAGLVGLGLQRRRSRRDAR